MLKVLQRKIMTLLAGDLGRYRQGGMIKVYCVVRWVGLAMPPGLKLPSGLMCATERSTVEPYLDDTSFIAELEVSRRMVTPTPEPDVVWLNQPIFWSDLTPESKRDGTRAFLQLTPELIVKAAAGSLVTQVLKPRSREVQGG